MATTAGSLVHVYYATGSGSAYSDDALEEVDLTPLYPRYTVYRVATDAKQMLTDSETPVIQFDDEGDSNFAAVTPSEIWYGAGYFILSTPQLAADVGRVHSGKYLTETSIFACAKRDLDETLGEEDVTVYGDESVTRTWTVKDWSMPLVILYASANATLETSGGNANSHIKLTHVAGGTAGNSITLTMTDTDQASTTVSVAGNDITVDLETSGGDVVATAEEVLLALNADTDVQALDITCELSSGETGAGVVATLVQTALSGGLNPIDFHSIHDGTRMCFRLYSSTSARILKAGFGFITSYKYVGGPTEVLKGEMTVKGMQYPLYSCAG